MKIPKITMVVGPTASGKTKLSIDLAQHKNAEIISADSVQIYKGLDIGSAKPTRQEMQLIPHYMIDIISPRCKFSVADYQRQAMQCVEEITNRGNLPLIVGGTGLYINSILYPLSFTDASIDESFRAELNLQEATLPGCLYSRLQQVDPTTALRIHPNDTKRIIRALEVYKLTGRRMSEYTQDLQVSQCDATIIGIYQDRQELYALIEERVNVMIRSGLVEEVKSLLKEGVSRTSQAMQAIGYKEMVQYIDHHINLEEAIDMIKQNTRRYCKRQFTWFNKNKQIIWFNKNNYKSYAALLTDIAEYIQS